MVEDTVARDRSPGVGKYAVCDAAVMGSNSATFAAAREFYPDRDIRDLRGLVKALEWRIAYVRRGLAAPHSLPHGQRLWVESQGHRGLRDMEAKREAMLAELNARSVVLARRCATTALRAKTSSMKVDGSLSELASKELKRATTAAESPSCYRWPGKDGQQQPHRAVHLQRGAQTNPNLNDSAQCPHTYASNKYFHPVASRATHLQTPGPAAYVSYQPFGEARAVCAPNFRLMAERSVGEDVPGYRSLASLSLHGKDGFPFHQSMEPYQGMLLPRGRWR